MTDQVSAFLPPGALTSERVQQVLSGPIDGWRRDYFSTAHASVSCGPQASPRHSSGGESAETVSERPMLLLAGPGKRRLLELALGESLEGKILSDADRELIDAFANNLTSDLIARLSRVLGAGEGPAVRLELALDGRAIGDLLVNREALVTLVRSVLPARADQAPIAATRMGAVAHLPVKVEAVLGRSRLTIQDANGLAVGDVLVLDRALGEDAELRVQGGALVAVGQLVADNGHNTIRIASSGKGLN